MQSSANLRKTSYICKVPRVQSTVIHQADHINNLSVFYIDNLSSDDFLKSVFLLFKKQITSINTHIWNVKKCLKKGFCSPSYSPDKLSLLEYNIWLGKIDMFIVRANFMLIVLSVRSQNRNLWNINIF